LSSGAELDPIVLSFVDGERILDVACGRGKWGFLLRTNLWQTKVAKIDVEPECIVGIDVFRPSLKMVAYHRIYDAVICCHVGYLPFKDASFDVVLASEILEHLEKQDGERLLSEVERVSRKTIILTTPHFVRKRVGLPSPEGFNPYEQHVSKWTIKELRARKYRVYGVGFAPFALHTLFNALLSPLSFIVPELSTHLVAVKIQHAKTDI